MSEADKVFEELGYEKIVEREYKESESEDEAITGFILYRNEIKNLEISFWNNRTISKENNYDHESYLTIKELQAINKKCEELGWK